MEQLTAICRASFQGMDKHSYIPDKVGHISSLDSLAIPADIPDIMIDGQPVQIAGDIYVAAYVHNQGTP